MAITTIEAVFRENHGQQEYTAAGTLLGGAVMELSDGRCGVLQTNLVSGEKGSVRTLGTVSVKKGSVAFVVGDPVYWDVSADTAINVALAYEVGDIYMGRCMVAAASGAARVDVDLNGLPAPIVRNGILIDHADTQKFHIINAAQNPNGIQVISAYCFIAEVMAGSSEDQLIVSLYDSDDNALDTLTPSNTAADILNDVVIGAKSLWAATTGEAKSVIIPADKGAYWKVSQATAGTPAGKLRCFLSVAEGLCTAVTAV